MHLGHVHRVDDIAVLEVVAELLRGHDRAVVLGLRGRSAQMRLSLIHIWWYYLSSLANQGLGNSIDALQDARRAVQLDPNNTEYP